MRSGSGGTRAEPCGCEKLTLAERFVGLLHVPYFPAAVMLALAVNDPGALLGSFLDTLSIEKAISAALPARETLSLWRLIAGQVFHSGFALYLFLVVRSMRLRVVAAERQLVSLLPEGRKDFVRAFGRLSSWYGPVALALIILLLFLSPVLQRLRSAAGPFAFTQIAAGAVGQCFIGGTVMWVYFISIYGLHRIGRLPLKVKPFREDPMLGLRPFGALSLSLALAYFGSTLFLLAHYVLNTTYAPDQHVVLLIALSVLGIVMFFLPLSSLHRHMVQVKQRERAFLRTRLARLADSLDGDERPRSTQKETLMEIRRILTFTVSSTIESRMASMPTWPFDLGILARLVTILLAVATGLVVRVIAVRMGF